MPKISDETISDILKNTDIVDLIGEKVALSKQGKGYFGLCPFHHEKTPSFSVEPERKIYNCFSCGEKGNAITFLQKTDNLTFVEAVENLAYRANMNIDFQQFKTENPNARFYNINNEALKFYKIFLSNTKTGLKAKEYLMNRGISDDVINTFDFGLAPTAFDTLTKTLTSNGVLVSDLYDLGLVKQSKNETFYDLFRDRIIIPIKDHRNNVIAFSGRVYLEGDKQAKYINSPQSMIFTKSNVLFNMNNALQHIKNNNRVVLFEGPMDVIAAHRSGINESVASMGTSLTKEQVKLMKRYTDHVVICYDGDKAGVAATNRAIELFRHEQMEIKIVILPDNLDPDDFITKFSKEKLKNYINEQWIDGLEFEYHILKTTSDFTKMLDIEKFKKNIFDLIKNQSNSIVEAYITKIAKEVNISVESIRQDFIQYTRRHTQFTRRKGTKKLEIDSKYNVAERRVLSYFLDSFRYLRDYNGHEKLEYLFIDERSRDIKMIIEDMYFQFEDKENEKIDITQFLSQLTPELRHFFESKVEGHQIELSDQEYKDCRDVLLKYEEEMEFHNKESQIEQAITNEDKIKLALERDKKLKEEYRWTKKK